MVQQETFVCRCVVVQWIILGSLLSGCVEESSPAVGEVRPETRLVMPSPSGGWLSPSELLTVSAEAHGSIVIMVPPSADFKSYDLYRGRSDGSTLEYVGRFDGIRFQAQLPEDPTSYVYQVARVEPEEESFPWIPLSNAAAAPSSLPSSCLRETRIEELKRSSDPWEVRDLVREMYEDCGETLVAASLPMPSAEYERMAIFAAVLALTSAAYDWSETYEIVELVQSERLDCDNYAVLTALFYEMLRGEGYPEEISIVGFDGGAIGNHAQMFITSGERSLMIDPTLGIFARVRFDQLISGVAVSGSFMGVIYPYWGDARQDPWIHEVYLDRVVRAIAQGSYRPEDELYRRVWPKSCLLKKCVLFSSN